MELLFTLTLIACFYLLKQNYKLEKRWRCMRYCWQSMSDLAGNRLGDEPGTDHQWREVLEEQKDLMGRFGAAPLSEYDFREYEAALIDRDYPILLAHR